MREELGYNVAVLKVNAQEELSCWKDTEDECTWGYETLSFC